VVLGAKRGGDYEIPWPVSIMLVAVVLVHVGSGACGGVLYCHLGSLGG